MIYLFWSFAIVWIGLFLYLRFLVRRSRALEEDLRRLGMTADADAPASAPREGAGVAGRGEAPTTKGSASP